jgi:hypothetical protein
MSAKPKFINLDKLTSASMPAKCSGCQNRDIEINHLREALTTLVAWFTSRSPGFQQRCASRPFKEAKTLLKWKD